MVKKKITTTKETKIMMGVLFSVLLLTMFYTMYSLISWRTYERNYTAWPSVAQATIDRVLSLPVTNDAERTTKLIELEKVNEELLERSDGLCDTWFLSGWQASIVKRIKASETRCKDIQARIAPAIAAYDYTVSYLEEESTITALINGSTLQQSTDETKWKDNAVSWKSLNEKLERLETSAAFKPTKDKIQVAVKSVLTAWQGILVANDSKEASRYLRATSQLSASYDDLRSILESTSYDNYKKLLDTLDRAYHSSFNQ